MPVHELPPALTRRALLLHLSMPPIPSRTRRSFWPPLIRPGAGVVRLVADESCDFTLVVGLRAAGHDVVAITEAISGADDEQVMALAAAERGCSLPRTRTSGSCVCCGSTQLGRRAGSLPGACSVETHSRRPCTPRPTRWIALWLLCRRTTRPGAGHPVGEIDNGEGVHDLFVRSSEVLPSTAGPWFGNALVERPRSSRSVATVKSQN